MCVWTDMVSDGHSLRMNWPGFWRTSMKNELTWLLMDFDEEWTDLVSEGLRWRMNWPCCWWTSMKNELTRLLTDLDDELTDLVSEGLEWWMNWSVFWMASTKNELTWFLKDFACSGSSVASTELLMRMQTRMKFPQYGWTQIPWQATRNLQMTPIATHIILFVVSQQNILSQGVKRVFCAVKTR